MREAVIVDAVRTPIGRGKPGKGALNPTHPVDLLAHSLRAVVDRTGVDPERIDDVIGGCVDQVNEQAMNITRSAVLAAGLPESVPATTVDRQCGSSQQAVHFGAQGVMAGAYDIVIAAGVESMSRVPMWSNVTNGADPFGPGVAARYPDGLVPQGVSAELIAAKWELPRSELDRFSLESHQRAAAAHADGAFDDELIPSTVSTPTSRPSRHLARDPGRPEARVRGPGRGRALSADRLEGHCRQLQPINDGGAAVMITSPEIAKELGLSPRRACTRSRWPATTRS